jgi:hypothetical protein
LASRFTDHMPRLILFSLRQIILLAVAKMRAIAELRLLPLRGDSVWRMCTRQVEYALFDHVRFLWTIQSVLEDFPDAVAKVVLLASFALTPKPRFSTAKSILLDESDPIRTYSERDHRGIVYLLRVRDLQRFSSCNKDFARAVFKTRERFISAVSAVMKKFALDQEWRQDFDCDISETQLFFTTRTI